VRSISSAIAIVSLCLLASCGGGGDKVAGDFGSGGTGVTLTVGPVLGFGSVIVGDVKYDDSSAQISIEDGDDDGAGLQLGMVVRLEGKLNSDRVSGKADKIESGAEIRGTVSVVDVAAKRFVAMGAQVLTTPATVFVNMKADLSDLAAGDIVQVHGLPDGAGVVAAARVQKRPAQAQPVYKTVGVVAASPAPTASSFKLGTLTVNFAANAVRDLPVPIPAGTLVRVKTQAAPVADAITATQVRPFMAQATPALAEAEIEGYITELAGASFKVSGLAVAVSAGTQYVPGNTTQADLANGKRVEAEGKLVNGVLQAERIKFKDAQSGGNEFRFEGPVTDYVSAADFKVKGQRIDASGAGVRFDNGTAADLANGKDVEVRGNVIDNGKLIATRVRFK
jgi:Domain of unknown function (DUF5666)